MIRTDDDGGLWLVLNETISAHPEEVLAAFTTSGGITRWLSVDAQVELRKAADDASGSDVEHPNDAGEIALYWTKDRSKKTTRRIIELDPSGRVVWQWFARRTDLEITLHWTIEPDVEHGAKVTLEAGPFPEQVEMVEAMVDEAVSWTWHLCNLRSALEVGFDMRAHRPI